MAGFGLSSFGLSPYGTGTPVSASDPPDGAAGARYIDPSTRDYAQDTTTRQLQQMPPIRQRVLLSVLTLKNSSTVYNGGINNPRKMGTFFEVEMQRAVRDTLKQLTDVEKVIRIDNITTVRSVGSRSQTTISYTDLATNQQHSETI